MTTTKKVLLSIGIGLIIGFVILVWHIAQIFNAVQ
jgi:Na+/H+ antiporter NhaC